MLKKEQFVVLSLNDKRLMILNLCQSINNEDFSMFGDGFLDSVGSDQLYQTIYNAIFDFVHTKKMEHMATEQAYIKKLQTKS